MNFRERMIRTVRFEPVDEMPFDLSFGLMPGLLDEWHDQGLPAEVQTPAQVKAYFGFAPYAQRLPLFTGLEPPFETKILEQTDEYCISIDNMGRTNKVIYSASSLPRALDFPVKDWDTWQPFKERLEYFPERVGADLERIVANNRAAGVLNAIGGRGFYWFGRDLMGDEGWCIAYHEQPDLATDIVETFCALREQVLDATLQRVELDEIHLGEDMAYRNASMIGPKLFERFMKSYYRRIHTLVEKYNVPIFSMDSDGCLNELAGWFADCGVNYLSPHEVQAGNDIRVYRRQFGKQVAFGGGLDKRVLTQGREAIDRMLEGTIPFMKETGGGWCIGLDHRALSGTPLADFQYYVDRVRQMNKF